MGHLTDLQNLCAIAFRWFWVTCSNPSVTHQARCRPCLQSCHRQCSTPVPWVEWDPGYAGVDLLFEVRPVPFPRAGRRKASRSHCSPISQLPSSMSPISSVPHCSETSGCYSQVLQLSPTLCPVGNILCLGAIMTLGCSGQRGRVALK